MTGTEKVATEFADRLRQLCDRYPEDTSRSTSSSLIEVEFPKLGFTVVAERTGVSIRSSTNEQWLDWGLAEAGEVQRPSIRALADAINRSPTGIIIASFGTAKGWQRVEAPGFVIAALWDSIMVAFSKPKDLTRP